MHEVADALLPGASMDAPLMEAGLDSLGAVEFRNRLTTQLGDAVELPDTLVFDFPSLRQLEEHVCARVLARESASSGNAHALSSPGARSDSQMLLQLLGGLSQLTAITPDESEEVTRALAPVLSFTSCLFSSCSLRICASC